MDKKAFKELAADFLASTSSDPVKVKYRGRIGKVLGATISTGRILIEYGYETDYLHYSRLKRV